MDGYALECVNCRKKLNYNNYEIILLPDYASENINGVKIVPTGSVTLDRKRNIGIANAVGFCAFIDSDTYPNKDWLSNAIQYFNDLQIATVGGLG